MIVLSTIKINKMVKKKSKKIKESEIKEDIYEFLEKIKKRVDKLKRGKKKEYSLLCCILLSFYENRKTILDKTLLNESVKKEIEENENKIISSYVNNGHNVERVNLENYFPKFYRLIRRNNCFIPLHNEQIELNEQYIRNKKETVYRYIFGEKILNNKLRVKRRIIKKLRKINKKKKDDKNSIEEEEESSNNQEKSIISLNDSQKKNEELSERSEKENYIDLEINENDTSNNDSVQILSKESEIKKKKKKKGKRKKKKKKKKKKKNNFEDEKEKIIIDNELSLSNKDDNGSTINYSNNSLNDSCLKTQLSKDENNDKLIEQKKEEKRESQIEAIKDIFIEKLICIIKKAEEFLSLINKGISIESIKDIDNIMLDIQILYNYKDDIAFKNCLITAKNDSLELIKYFEHFLDDNKKTNSNTNLDYKSEINMKNLQLLIYRIFTKLSQFILDYNFIEEIINNNLEKKNKYIVLKDIKIFLDENKSILNLDNVIYLEKLFENELVI